MAYSDFSVTTGATINAGHQNANMINMRFAVNGTNATATPASNENLKTLRTDVDALVLGDTIPIGSIYTYSATTAPTDYFNCDGSSLNKVTYSELFDVVGFTFGGTGNTYSLPDLKASHIRGIGTSTIFTDNTEVVTIGEVINDNIQGHYHERHYHDELDYSIASGGTIARDFNGFTSAGSIDNVVRDPVTDGTNGTPRTGKETRPKAIGMNFIIKYQ
jgi:microcystin-dependent protein